MWVLAVVPGGDFDFQIQAAVHGKLKKHIKMLPIILLTKHKVLQVHQEAIDALTIVLV